MTSTSLLKMFDKHSLYSSFTGGIESSVNLMLSKDNHYTLFRAEDLHAWIIFTVVFAVLIVFDNLVLHQNPKALTITRAVCYTFFWIMCAFGFCTWVYYEYGESAAFMWTSGYMLEWMLSFDNLFVFHMIFSVYGTPDRLKHRPLYLGICGAVFFRLIFIFIGEYLMHAMYFMHFIFGAFLVYTGIKTITVDDEDDDPSQNPFVLWLQTRVPFVSAYDERGSFFVKVPIDERGNPILTDTMTAVSAPGSDESRPLAEEDAPRRYGTVDFTTTSARAQRTQTRATMLFLVVCCLEISDLLFAVDSVSAIVAQVNDLFLAYTSAVFAMLGLRATFFIIDVLVKLFSLLKYGVGAVLVFIGIKLIISHFYHIPPAVVCAVLVTAIAGSMIASVTQQELEKKAEGKAVSEVTERMAKMNSPIPSPAPAYTKLV